MSINANTQKALAFSTLPVLFLMSTFTHRLPQPPPRPPIAPTIAGRTTEERLLGVRQRLVGIADASESMQSLLDSDNEESRDELAAYYYWFIMDAAPGSSCTLYSFSGIAGRPRRLGGWTVPKGRSRKQQLAAGVQAEIPALVAAAVRDRGGIGGSPILQDARSLCDRLNAGERVVLVVQSDFEEQSALFPSTVFADTPKGRRRASEELPPPAEAPEKVILAHVQSGRGQTPGRARQLLAVFASYFRSWGTEAVEVTEAGAR